MAAHGVLHVVIYMCHMEYSIWQPMEYSTGSYICTIWSTPYGNRGVDNLPSPIISISDLFSLTGLEAKFSDVNGVLSNLLDSDESFEPFSSEITSGSLASIA